MGGKKVKGQQLKVKSWEELDQTMIGFSHVSAKLKLHQDALEAALATVREAYARDIDPLVVQANALEAAIEEFAEVNKAAFKPAPSGDGRSYEHAGVVVGFRRHPETVKIPHRTTDQEAALEYLRIYREELIRLVPEFDKPAILKALTDGNAALVEALREHGISLKPGKDEFFCRSADRSVT